MEFVKKFWTKLRQIQWWQYWMPCVSMVFVTVLAMMVRTQSAETGVGAAHVHSYMTYMITIAAMVLVFSMWSIWKDANILGMICALAILLCVGGSYQFLFTTFTSFASSVAMGLVAGCVTFLVWRKMQVLNDTWFVIVILLILGLLVSNLLWAEIEKNGARIQVEILSTGKYIQPGEFVKVLLVPLCASSYRSRKRGIAYCLTALACCAVMLVCLDMGTLVMVFAMLLLAFYLLFDNRKMTLWIIVISFLLFIAAVYSFEHAKERILIWGKAMKPGGNSQQHNNIRAVLFGGFFGLGLERAGLMTNIFAAKSDGALAGIMAVYGVPMLCIVNAAYAYLASMAAKNRSIHPSGYLTLAMVSMYVFSSVILNVGGSIDIIPFSGLCSSFISYGTNAMVCAGILVGLAAAALHPIMKEPKEG